MGPGVSFFLCNSYESKLSNSSEALVNYALTPLKSDFLELDVAVPLGVDGGGRPTFNFFWGKREELSTDCELERFLSEVFRIESNS